MRAPEACSPVEMTLLSRSVRTLLLQLVREARLLAITAGVRTERIERRFICGWLTQGCADCTSAAGLGHYAPVAPRAGAGKKGQTRGQDGGDQGKKGCQEEGRSQRTRVLRRGAG